MKKEETDSITLKRLSTKGYCSKNLEDIARHILSFHRTIIHQNDLIRVNKLFKNLSVPLTRNSILNYPGYMKALVKKGLNPFDFRVIHIRKNTVIETSRISDWLDRARRFWQ